MRIDLDAVRRHLLRQAGYFPPNTGSVKLPPDFEVDKATIFFDGEYSPSSTLTFRVLTSCRAKAINALNGGKSRRPHRILTWCWVCNGWQFTGRFKQHLAVHGRENALKISYREIRDA